MNMNENRCYLNFNWGILYVLIISEQLAELRPSLIGPIGPPGIFQSYIEQINPF